MLSERSQMLGGMILSASTWEVQNPQIHRDRGQVSGCWDGGGGRWRGEKEVLHKRPRVSAWGDEKVFK